MVAFNVLRPVVAIVEGGKMLAEEIKKNALKLDVVARVHLVESLLESLDKTDPEIEEIWVAESERRYHAYKQGLVEGIPLEQLRAKIEA
jgi:putative addiction module component (TIGR02574 family)